MSRAFDVAIVGAGIVGLGAAYAAVRRGRRVVVIDRSLEPIGASIRNFGHLCIGAQAGRAREYAQTARPIWLELARDAGFWLRESGTLVVARAKDELALLESAVSDGEVTMLDRLEVARRTGVKAGAVVGGAHVLPDLQTNPRVAAPAIRHHLARLGVEFRYRTAATGVGSGMLETSRGRISAGTVVLAVNHDLDNLLPDVAEAHDVQRCTLDMLRVRAPLASELSAPVLTGWSLVRYARFAGLPGATAVRERLARERPDLAAYDVNQMYTQLPDGTVLVGDTHQRGIGTSPFADETAGTLLLREFEGLFGTRPEVVERWQGVYASGPGEFLIAEPFADVVALTVTTGIGMTTGLGFTETELAPILN